MRICCSSRHMLLDFIHLLHIVKVEYDVIFVVYLLHFYSSLGFQHFVLICLLDICLPCSSVSILAREGDCSGISWICFFFFYSFLPFLSLMLVYMFWENSFHCTTQVYRELFSLSSQNLFHKHLKTGIQMNLTSLLKQSAGVFFSKYLPQAKVEATGQAEKGWITQSLDNPMSFNLISNLIPCMQTDMFSS